MRSKRLRRFRRHFPVAFFLVKLVLIWYLVVFSFSYLTSGTVAHFFDMEEADAKVLAGYWADGWDGSSLTFIQDGNENIKACDDPVEVAMEIKNVGDEDMVSGSSFDIYYIENGNPEKHGEKLGEGNIPVLNSNESTEITYLAQEPGVYAFLAQQPEGHPEEDTVWSMWAIVNCPPGQAKQDVEEETKDPAEVETEDEQNQETESNEEDDKEEPEKETETTEDGGDIDKTEEEETAEEGDES
ncbi:amyloid fiber anchoring/assembly protein TapA [Virgibacillus oceani]